MSEIDLLAVANKLRGEEDRAAVRHYAEQEGARHVGEKTERDDIINEDVGRDSRHRFDANSNRARQARIN
jgi:hypothetical protein